MSQRNIDKQTTKLNDFIENSIKNNKPIAAGTKGTISYMQSMVRQYSPLLIKVIKESEDKAYEMLKNFKEDYEGETNILEENFENAIGEIKEKFKKAHWK